jgi:ribosomal protein S6
VNEKRFVEEVQGGLIDTDEDGLTDLNYTIAKREYLFNTEHEIIDFKCEQDIPSHVEY